MRRGGFWADASRPGRLLRAEHGVRWGVRGVGILEWRQEHGGMTTAQAKGLKELEWENGQLRKAVADLTLDTLILQDAAKGNC